MKYVFPLASLALLAACSGGAKSTEEGAKPVAAVRTAPVELGETSAELTVYGAAEAEPGNEHSLATQAEATVVTINAPTGTAVASGQVIAILTPSAASRFDSAKAASDVTAANSALARAIRLRGDGLVSDAEVETARSAARSASAARSSITQRQATLVLRAPNSGTVENLTARAGDVIPAGTTIVTIGIQGDLRARFGIEPALAVRIRTGQPISLLPINRGQVIATTVVGVQPRADAITQLAAVFARIPSGSGMGAGQALKASIRIGGSTCGLTVPYAALLDDGGKSYVFVVKGGVAKARDVAPGNSAGDRVQILSGLQPGERVVTEGGTALEDGMAVREEGAAAAKTAK